MGFENLCFEEIVLQFQFVDERSVLLLCGLFVNSLLLEDVFKESVFVFELYLLSVNVLQIQLKDLYLLFVSGFHLSHLMGEFDLICIKIVVFTLQLLLKLLLHSFVCVAEELQLFLHPSLFLLKMSLQLMSNYRLSSRFLFTTVVLLLPPLDLFPHFIQLSLHLLISIPQFLDQLVLVLFDDMDLLYQQLKRALLLQ